MEKKQNRTDLCALLKSECAFICTNVPPFVHYGNMIGSLHGRLLDIQPASVLLEVGGIGYSVRLTPASVTNLRIGDEAFFYTHHHVREDAEDLFGFLTQQDQRLFAQLIAISGVGPKSAMTILSVGSAESVRAAIMAGDLATLTSVPGVGKKTAQKIVLELKGQLVDEDADVSGDRDVIEALQSLGYSSLQAREALKNMSVEIKNTSDRVREALRVL
mgnify:CR=1 FL=1